MKYPIKNRYTNETQFIAKIDSTPEEAESMKKRKAVLWAIENEISLAEANLAGDNLDWSNLAEANLAEANLSKASLYWSNLYGANLSEANLYGANLAGVNLIWANLYRARLDGANLARANLYRARLDGANLVEANLAGANLDGAKYDLFSILKIQLGEVSDELTLELMRWDCSVLENGKQKFEKWIETDEWPFSGEGTERLFNFQEKKHLWKPGAPTMTLVQIWDKICEEKGLRR